MKHELYLLFLFNIVIATITYLTKFFHTNSLILKLLYKRFYIRVSARSYSSFCL